MSSQLVLPTEPQARTTLDPRDARVMLAGFPKSGKTSLLAQWAPKETLIIDTQNGTTLLDGEHYVVHVDTWQKFCDVVDAVVVGGHAYRTIGLDMIDDLWKFADLEVSKRRKVIAAGLVDYGKGITEQEALFREQLGRLVASPFGLWFLSHTDQIEEEGKQRYIPKLDKRVRSYVQGVCHFVFLAETLGPIRQLRTQPSARFEAGGRVTLPDPMPLDARALYLGMYDGLNPQPAVQAPVAAAEPVSEPEEPEEPETTSEPDPDPVKPATRRNSKETANV